MVMNSDWDDWQNMSTLRVVKNEKNEYSIWPTNKKLPEGWEDAGFHGNKAQCLKYIRQVWKLI